MYSYFLPMVLSVTLQMTNAAKVLMYPVNHRSHAMYFNHLATELIKKGHTVSILYGSTFTLPESFENSNINTIKYFMPQPPFGTDGKETEHLLNVLFNGTKLQQATILFTTLNRHIEKGEEETEFLLRDTAVMSQLKDSQFDFLVIDVFLSHAVLPYKLGLPFATMGIPFDFWTLKIPINPSYTPLVVDVGGSDMSFIQRTKNVMMYTAAMGHPSGSRLVKEYVPEKEMIIYTEIMSQASLIFSLHADGISYITPQMPNLINIGGLICRPSKPLPNDLQLFLDSAKEGVVLVSFGSWLDFLPDHISNILLKAFTSIKEKVIWKSSRSVDSSKIPKNVKVVSWMPQNDILAHPNCLLFITHGGYSSIVEAVSNGVPMVVMPVGMDQFYNAALVENIGFGRALDLTSITAEGLTMTIEQVIQDKEISKNIARVSDTLRNPLVSPGDRAVWMMEHVIKYGDAHIRSPAHQLTWYQYHCLDVILFLLAIPIIVLHLAVFIFWKLVNHFKSKPKVKKS